MKKELILIAGLIVCFAAVSVAEEAVQASETVLVTEAVEVVTEAVEAEAPVVDFGNKICPISKEPVGTMGEGYKIVYNGKSYNLCCEMCAADFNKDPEGYIKMMMEKEDHAGAEEEGHQHE